jgi:hypothetical protein
VRRKQQLRAAVDWKIVLQDARCKMQDARCKMQDARCKMQDARCKMQGEAENVIREKDEI